MNTFEDVSKSIMSGSSGFKQVEGSMKALGIDSEPLLIASALVNLIGGGVQAFTGLMEMTKSIKEIKAVEGTAHLVKYGPYALAVAAIAAAAGLAVGVYIGQSISEDVVYEGDYSTDQGRRRLNV